MDGPRYFRPPRDEAEARKGGWDEEWQAAFEECFKRDEEAMRILAKM